MRPSLVVAISPASRWQQKKPCAGCEVLCDSASRAPIGRDRMCKQLGVDDEGLFKEVMRRVREKLKDFPNNLTKFPILLLEVPRTTTEGINLISSTAKDVATDKIGSAIHVIVSASSAAVALAFDAGGTERQEDIWVADLTEEETKEFLALHGHENKWEDFVDACGFRIGDLAKACENLKKGMSLDDTKQECQRVADDEVRGFMELQVHPKVTGREMVKELLTAYPAGILNVVNGIRILPREVAELIRNKSCPAVYFHLQGDHREHHLHIHQDAKTST
ncbi:unnamed protein product, partial [Effrenium voratum]